jgi:hypothetical protein
MYQSKGKEVQTFSEKAKSIYNYMKKANLYSIVETRKH